MHHHTTSRRAAAALAATALTAIITVTPAHARQDPGELLTDARTSQPRGTDGSHRAPGPTSLTVDDDAVEYLQVALGALGGMVLVGAVAAAASRRNGHHAHPA